jgi:hypothetical protein
MFKALSVPEKLFSVIMWVVSLIFAGFLMGLGQLVIGDLPMATSPPEISQFIDPAKLAVVQDQETRLQAKLDAIDPRFEAENLKTDSARQDYRSAKEQYDNWLSTRQATTDPAQDPEVISRTKKLDILSEAVRSAEKVQEGISAERLEITTAQNANRTSRQVLEQAAQGAYASAEFKSELFVFGLRLLVTLPLLLVAGWLLIKKRKSEYWPLMRGFVLFAVYAFFFELVPYLPSYGGYIRYIVGIALTIVAGHYTIKWMRHYLATRAVVEKQAEVQRKQSIRYEDALKKMTAGVCPGCERPVTTTGDVLADYCVHCGMNLYDHCGTCETRKLSFFRYCMKCGTGAAADTEPEGAVALT